VSSQGLGIGSARPSLSTFQRVRHPVQYKRTAASAACRLASQTNQTFDDPSPSDQLGGDLLENAEAWKVLELSHSVVDCAANQEGRKPLRTG
jgi:hypothetical protein